MQNLLRLRRYVCLLLLFVTCAGCAHDPNTRVQKLMQKADVCFSRGQFAEALLVKGAPTNAGYRYHLGMIYQKLNDVKRARIELEKSIRMDPQAPYAEKASRALSELSES